MKKNLQQRLKSYSLAAGTIVAAGTADGQIIYTDINPDVIKSNNGDFYDLDLNNDATIDFRIDLFESSFASTFFSYSYRFFNVDPNGLNAVANSSSSYARALNKGDNVGAASMSFNSFSMTMAGIFKFASSTFTFATSWGNWNNVVDKYLGLKLIISGQTHYGWARLDVNSNTGSFTIKDYAYEATANQTILAGIIPADPATNVTANDVDENSNGLDVEVEFDMAANEATVGEYRIIVVKSAAAATFNLANAKAVPAANYTVVTPTGSNISQILAASAKDSDGDAIKISTPYKVFVMTKADGINATDDVLSTASDELILNTTAGVAFNAVANDIGDELTSEDFEVTFSKAINETGVSEYRVIVVKAADVASFDIVAAQAVTAGNYTAIAPTGSNIQQALATGAKDKDGDDIVLDTPYNYFVLSLSNGTIANIDNLSTASNEITLSNTIGIGELDEKVISIYSNGQFVTIDMGNISFNNSFVSIMDASGKMILQSQISNQKTRLNLNNANGIYVVALEADGKVLRKKILINR